MRYQANGLSVHDPSSRTKPRIAKMAEMKAMKEPTKKKGRSAVVNKESDFNRS